MFRYQLLKLIPRKRKLRGTFLHNVIGDRLFDPNVWKWDTRNVCAGLALGTFIAFTPTFPFQMIMAAAFSLLFKVNMPAAMLACWITNPITMPFIYIMEYKVGTWLSNAFGLPEIVEFQQPIEGGLDIMDIPKPHRFFTNTMKSVKNIIMGGLLFATVSSAFVYGLFYFLLTHIYIPSKWKRQPTPKDPPQDKKPGPAA